MINAGDGKEDRRELICRYIKDQQTLILLVSEAQQDAELTSDLDLAQEFDPNLDRILRLLTKLDTFDSPDQGADLFKTRSSHSRLQKRGGWLRC